MSRNFLYKILFWFHMDVLAALPKLCNRRFSFVRRGIVTFRVVDILYRRTCGKGTLSRG